MLAVIVFGFEIVPLDVFMKGVSGARWSLVRFNLGVVL
jgi:hypothetical protein